MNAPRGLSPVFVPTSVPETRIFKPSRKFVSSCYPSQARGREEITRSVCSPTGTSFTRRRSPGRGPSPEPPEALRRSIAGQCQTSPSSRKTTSPTSPTSPTRMISRPSNCRKPSVENVVCCKPSAEAAKTFVAVQTAIDGAMRVVQTASDRRSLPKSTVDVEADIQRCREYMSKSNLTAGDRRPSSCSNEDLESLCGTECTESTACSSSFSEDCGAGGRRVSPSLEDARRVLKERLRAEERSVRFTRSFIAKLEELRDVVAEEGSDLA